MKLTQEVADLTKDIEDLDAEMTESTEFVLQRRQKTSTLSWMPKLLRLQSRRQQLSSRIFMPKQLRQLPCFSRRAQLRSCRPRVSRWVLRSGRHLPTQILMEPLTRVTKQACKLLARHTQATRMQLVVSWPSLRLPCLILQILRQTPKQQKQ